jgi:hypothetical protein
MNRASSSQRNAEWKDLYIAALFEHDKTKLAQRIAVAQFAIAERKQELVSGNDADEKLVLDNAAFSLLALARCFSVGQLVAHSGFERRSKL